MMYGNWKLTRTLVTPDLGFIEEVIQRFKNLQKKLRTDSKFIERKDLLEKYTPPI